MAVSENHRRNLSPSEERRVALDWVTRRLRWEHLLEQARGRAARVTESGAGNVPRFDPFELQDTILGDLRDPFPALAAARRRGGMQAGPPDLFDDDVDFDIAP